MKHKRGETLEEIEPVYDLFTIIGDINPSESLSRVTYTGIKSMHSQKTMQPCYKEQNQKEEKHGRRRMKNPW